MVAMRYALAVVERNTKGVVDKRDDCSLYVRLCQSMWQTSKTILPCLCYACLSGRQGRQVLRQVAERRIERIIQK